jgi:hypothetical protein
MGIAVVQSAHVPMQSGGIGSPHSSQGFAVSNRSPVSSP